MTLLMVDIDKKFNKKTLKEFITGLKSLMYVSFFRYKKIEVFDTIKGYHIYIDLNNFLNDFEICFYQLYLLSDRNRELFNFRRVLNNDKNFNVLFQKKFKVKNGNVELKSYEVKNEKLTNLINEEIEKEVKKISQEALNRLAELEYWGGFDGKGNIKCKDW